METGHRRDWEGQEGWEAVWEAEAILGTMGWGQGLTTFSWIWLLDTEMLREACPTERGEGRGGGGLTPGSRISSPTTPPGFESRESSAAAGC